MVQSSGKFIGKQKVIIDESLNTALGKNIHGYCI
jgi:hypothetical protein